MKTLQEILEDKQINEAALRSIDDIAEYFVDNIDEDVLYNILDAIMSGKVSGFRHPGEMLDDEKFRTELFSRLSDRMIEVMDENF